MQAVSSSWATNIAAPSRTLSHGVQIAWTRATGGTGFFTIGTSTIGGPDQIKSGGTAAAFIDKYQFSQYSQYATSWHVERSLGQFPYGTMMAQADLELDNSSNLFTPAFDATIGNYIVGNRPLKLSVGFNNESLQLFVGLSGVPEVNRQSRVLNMHAFDAFDYINNYTSSLGNLSNMRGDQVIQQGLIEMGFSSNQYVLDQALQTPIGIVAPFGLRWGDIFNSICEAEQGVMFADENGIIRFWNRQHFLTNTTSVQAFTFSNIEELETQTTSVYNDVIVRAKPRKVATKQKVWELRSPVQIPSSSTFAYPVDFSDNDGALPVTIVDIPVAFTTATTSSFKANTNSDGSGSDATGSVTISSSALVGTQYQLTFSNSSPNPVYLTSLIIHGAPAKINVVVEQRYTDQGSIDTYGKNPGNNGKTLVITNDYIQDSGTASSLAYTLVNEYKDPRRRYVATVFANPALQFGDFVSLTNSDTNETKNMYITGTKMHLSREGQVSQVIEFEERNITQRYFQIGTSLIAGSDPIAP